MKPLILQVSATITLNAIEAGKILDALALRIIDALPALREPRPPAPPLAQTAPAFLSAAQLARRWQMPENDFS